MITDLKVSIFLLNGDREQKQLLHPTLLTTVNWKERPFASANFFLKKKLPTLFDTVTANSYEH